jgi:hypothetical protein
MLHASHSHSGHFKIKGYTFIVSRKFSHKSRQESIKILLQHATKPFLENRVLLFQRKPVEDLSRMEKDRYSVEPNASERKLFREKRHLIIASLRFRSEELWQGVNGRVHGFITGDPTQKNSAQALTME